MPDSVRFHGRDSLLALLCTYLMNGMRDLSMFNPAGSPNLRKISADGVDFRIVRVVPTQAREKPGVNLVVFDDHKYAPYVGSDRRVAPVGIHIYNPAGSNPVKAERTVLKIVRKVDEALYGCGVSIYNFDVSPPVALGPALFWRPMKAVEDWLNLTNLNVEQNVHYARNFSVWWDEKSIQ